MLTCCIGFIAPVMPNSANATEWACITARREDVSIIRTRVWRLRENTADSKQKLWHVSSTQKGGYRRRGQGGWRFLYAIRNLFPVAAPTTEPGMGDSFRRLCQVIRKFPGSAWGTHCPRGSASRYAEKPKLS